MNIEFGTLLTVKDQTNQVDVVTNIGEGNSFGVYVVFEGDNGPHLRILAGGTIFKDDVDQLIGTTSLQEVEEMVQRGFTDLKIAEITIGYFRENAKKGSRTI